MKVLKQRLHLDVNEVEIAYRGGSLELNESRASVEGHRVCVDGCWGIVSSQGGTAREDSLERLEKALRYRAELGRCPGLPEQWEEFSGRVELGIDLSNVENLADLIASLCKEVEELDPSILCETVVIFRRKSRTIETESARAYEVKRIVEVTVSLAKRGTGAAGATSFRALVPMSERDASQVVEECFREAVERLRRASTLKSLSLFERGKACIVLDNEAAAALFHEVSHLLDPLAGGAHVKGSRILPPEIHLIDDPTLVYAPSLRFFDDEGVKCRRRVLVEEGTVVDLHTTLSTHRVSGSEPGSAHGLFTTPVPFHTTLVVEGGDWRDSEILEETRRGFLIGGVAVAYLEGGWIRIVPQYAYRIDRGELVEALRIRGVKVPIQALKSIDAVGREQRVRCSYEKDWLVAEVSPVIRLIGLVE